MIDTIAMVLCVFGFGCVSIGARKLGFALSLAGSGFWLIFSIAVESNALLLQSVAFLVFSGVGLGKCFQRQ